MPLLLLLLSLAGTGCLFSPDEKPPKKPVPIIYLEPLSPQNVLSNMITAYVNRDSTGTGLVYDPTYRGQSEDPSGIVGDFDTTRDDEVFHVWALHLDPSIIGVFLDFGNPAIWQVLPPDAQDPPEWRVIQLNRATISIATQSSSGFSSKDQTLTYTFKPTVDSGTGKTTWKIIRWKEYVSNPPKP